jgi:Na+/H+ antiporter NhaD/arsenite permease-like protein
LVIILILTEKINRSIVAISGAVVTYYTLIVFGGLDYSVIVGLLFGTETDGYVNLRSLILIIGIMFIIQIAEEAGVFQFLAAYVIKRSNGNSVSLMIIFCFLAVFLSAILNSIVTVMILIPLTIMISRILNTNPSPYILTQAVIVNIGSTVFSISSISNILITTTSNISFRDFLFNVGIFSIIVAFLTVPFFLFLYKSQLTDPDEELVKILAEFDVWNVVPSKKLFFTSCFSIVVLIVAFFIIPPETLAPDMIAITIALVLIFITHFQGIDEELILNKLNYQLLLYLLGIFTIAGGLEITGVISELGLLLNQVGGGFEPLIQVLFIMWVSALLSSMIDNIPITKVLIPIVDNFIPNSVPNHVSNNYYYGLAFGSNWGDNLTPMGDNILVVNLAEQNKRPIKLFDFWRLGFFTTLYQLSLASLYFILLFNLILGVIILIILIFLVFLIWLTSFKVKSLSSVKIKFKNLIVG